MSIGKVRNFSDRAKSRSVFLRKRSRRLGSIGVGEQALALSGRSAARSFVETHRGSQLARVRNSIS